MMIMMMMLDGMQQHPSMLHTANIIFYTLQTKTPVAGLTNLGNTCYMNSVLQALYATKELRDFVISCLESGGQLYTGMFNCSL